MPAPFSKSEAEAACQPDVSASASDYFAPVDSQMKGVLASAQYDSLAEFASWDYRRCGFLAARRRCFHHQMWLTLGAPAALVANAILKGDLHVQKCTSTVTGKYPLIALSSHLLYTNVLLLKSTRQSGQ